MHCFKRCTHRCVCVRVCFRPHSTSLAHAKDGFDTCTPPAGVLYCTVLHCRFRRTLKERPLGLSKARVIIQILSLFESSLPPPPPPSLHLLPLSLSLSHPHECLCACVRHIHKRTPHRTALTRSEPALHCTALHCTALHCTALNRKTATAPYSRHRRNAVVYLRKEGGCPAAALFVPRLRQCPGFQARVVRSFCIALWTRREAAEGDDLGGEDWAAEP